MTESKKSETNIIAPRTGGGPQPQPGAERFPCSVCGYMVWLAPSSREMHSDRVICKECVQELGELEHDPEPMTEAQRLEVARATGLHNDGLDRLWRRTVDDLKRKMKR